MPSSRPFGDWLRTRTKNVPHKDAAEALGVTRSRFTQIVAMEYATPYIAWQVQTRLGLTVPLKLVRGRG